MTATLIHRAPAWSYGATLCTSAVFAVVRCQSVCPSLCHVGVLYPDGWRYRQTSCSAL